MNRRLLCVAGVLVGITASVWALSSSAEAQPKRGTDLIRELKIPNTTYSAIVIAAYGGGANATSYAAVFSNGQQEFAVTVRGGETLIVPFQGGWSPADYTLKLNPDAPTFLLTAWGIQQNGGPIAFEPSRR